MSFAKAKISSLKLDIKNKYQGQDDKVWLLNLDQIEQNTGKIILKEYVNLSEIGNSTHYFTKGTVLYSKLRPYLNKVVIADEDGFATTELVPINCDLLKVNPEYLAYFLRSEVFLTFATNVVAGAKMPRMVMGEFWNYEIPLPPLAEQRRIASILDQADELRQKRQQAIEKLDQLLQATFIDMFGDPVSNPKGFLLVKLEDLVNKPITYGVLKPEEYTENGIPMLRIQDINTKKNLSHLTDFHLISNELSNQYKRTILNGHEIVISLVGTIGLVAKIPEEFKGFNIHRNLGVIDLCDKSLVDYILYFMKMPEFLILLERISKGGVHKLLNLADLRTFEFPIPPKDLQEKWSKIALGIEDQKQNLYKQLDMQNQFFSSLQNQAFNGTL